MTAPVNHHLILVTGAAGYVGSHCLVELLTSGYDVVALDNCINAVEGHLPDTLPESLQRVQSITGRNLLAYYKADLNNATELEDIFSKHRFSAVVHFASLKAVGESCIIPLEYYRNNVGGTMTLLDTMRAHSVRRLIFSSSATVYGTPEFLPITEEHHTGRNCTNPYGRTKYFIEEILKDLCASETDWSITSLRYFNPVGAHPSGMLMVKSMNAVKTEFLNEQHRNHWRRLQSSQQLDAVHYPGGSWKAAFPEGAWKRL